MMFHIFIVHKWTINKKYRYQKVFIVKGKEVETQILLRPWPPKIPNRSSPTTPPPRIRTFSCEWSCICHRTCNFPQSRTLRIPWFCTLSWLDYSFGVHGIHERTCISFCKDRTRFRRTFCRVGFFTCFRVCSCKNGHVNVWWECQ